MREQGLDVFRTSFSRNRLSEGKAKRSGSCACDVPWPKYSPLKHFPLAFNQLEYGVANHQNSVDHGTADDIVGRNIADRRSMKAALDLTIHLIDRKANQPSQEIPNKRRSKNPLKHSCVVFPKSSENNYMILIENHL